HHDSFGSTQAIINQMRRHPFIVRHARGGSANIVATHGYLKVNSSVVQATSENSRCSPNHLVHASR
ncbi:MAG: hypothetical protein EB005_07025, partial [Actinobacteria bacterium]|nr:hypothetical protein [Actinomycetota bacterium]